MNLICLSSGLLQMRSNSRANAGRDPHMSLRQAVPSVPATAGQGCCTSARRRRSGAARRRCSRRPASIQRTLHRSVRRSAGSCQRRMAGNSAPYGACTHRQTRSPSPGRANCLVAPSYEPSRISRLNFYLSLRNVAATKARGPTLINPNVPGSGTLQATTPGHVARTIAGAINPIAARVVAHSCSEDWPQDR